jgi:hypothetical protein
LLIPAGNAIEQPNWPDWAGDKMDFELDHLFICTEAEAPEAARLTDIGLVEGAPNVHTGQGTANRRFFFRNAYLELLWVHNPAKAQAGPIDRTRLWQRWKDRRNGVCPFGLCFRPTTKHTGRFPFPGWIYKAPYLREGSSLYVGTNSDTLSEPMLVYLPMARRPDSYPEADRQPFEHKPELNEITVVELAAPDAGTCSAELQSVVEAGLVKLRPSPEFILDLAFDGGKAGKTEDFRPELPLVFRW